MSSTKEATRVSASRGGGYLYVSTLVRDVINKGSYTGECITRGWVGMFICMSAPQSMMSSTKETTRVSASRGGRWVCVSVCQHVIPRCHEQKKLFGWVHYQSVWHDHWSTNGQFWWMHECGNISVVEWRHKKNVVNVSHVCWFSISAPIVGWNQNHPHTGVSVKVQSNTQTDRFIWRVFTWSM